MRAHTITTRRTATPIAALLVLAAALAFAPPAGAHVYWTHRPDAIGRANLDGTRVDKRFIIRGEQSSRAPFGLDVDAGHVYWGNGDAIGRADLDGTGVSESFISAPNARIRGVAVGAGYVYWASRYGAIGRANLDGTGVNQSLIGDARAGGGVAVGKKTGHVYWRSGCVETHQEKSCDIGRANLDGTGVDLSFIRGAIRPGGGLAVGSGHLYWASSESPGPRHTDTIGRAKLNGTGVDRSFISGAGGATGVSVDREHIYWTSHAEAIGRARLDGTRVDEGFISRGLGPNVRGVAVDSRAPGKSRPSGGARRPSGGGSLAAGWVAELLAVAPVSPAAAKAPRPR